MINLPEQYVIDKIYQYARRVIYNKFNNVYNFECAICNEGKSKGKKRRAYYMVEQGYFYCHNCNQQYNAIDWIKTVSNMPFEKIMQEVNEKEYFSKIPKVEIKNPIKIDVLPEDSINLFDEQQTNYYINNNIVKEARLFIKNRRINTAINKPRALYISLKDPIHKNRVCIPFYNERDKIIFYQTRSIFKEDEIDKPKYLSKLNSDKSIYGLNTINNSYDYLFIFEGPIDSMFTVNGIAIGGTSISSLQDDQLKKYNLFNKIWVLDNEVKTNENVKQRIIQLIESGERVFIWPDKLKKFKDINEVCMQCKLDKINPKFFIENSFEGSEALAKI